MAKRRYQKTHRPTGAEETKRECLKCSELFVSKWIGNRICAACDYKNQSASGVRECKAVFEGRNLVKD